MTVELTLKIEENLVKQASRFSNKTGIPISKLVADYFAQLDLDSAKKESELTPVVRSILGSLRGSKVTEQDYRNYLEEKYL
ncbi:MAG: hypothetical protein JW866_00340 [Ignavibacteriales bacterium]|nr:hypothetical protein [Ignavibacteriales bacterium]